MRTTTLKKLGITIFCLATLAMGGYAFAQMQGGHMMQGQENKGHMEQGQGAMDHGAMDHGEKAHAAGMGTQKAVPYALDTCPVTGGKLGSMGKPVAKVYVGREVQFCCAGCVGKFEADLKAGFQKVDKAIAARLNFKYPLDTCPITGKKLGSMGKPVAHKFEGREVQLCCAGCVGGFGKDLKASFAKLDAAVVAKQTANYPLDTCVVMGGKLGAMGKPVELVSHNQLVRLCCKNCVKQFDKNPVKHLISLADAYKKKEAPVWTCSMHPQVKMSKTGKCPLCGMNLMRAKGSKQ